MCWQPRTDLGDLTSSAHYVPLVPFFTVYFYFFQLFFSRLLFYSFSEPGTPTASCLLIREYLPEMKKSFYLESTTRMCSIKYGILLDSGRSDAQFITNASGNSPWTCWYGHGWDTMEGIFICGVGDSFRTGDFQSDRWGTAKHRI